MLHIINYIPKHGRLPRQKILRGDLQTTLKWVKDFAKQRSVDIWEITDDEHAANRGGHRVYGAVYDQMKARGEA